MIASLALVVFNIAPFAFAIDVPGLPLVPCGRSGQNLCTKCDLFQLLKNIIDFIVGALMPALGILLFVWAGFLILLGGASPDLVARGKTIFRDTFFGIMIMLGAWMITNTLILSVGATYNNAENWWQFTCVDTPSGTPPPIPTSTPTPPPAGNCTGVECKDSNLNICGQNTSANCEETGVNKWDSQIKAAAAGNQIGSGINTVALVKAIMSQESGGKINVTSPAGACGIMQLMPATANDNKTGCTSENITCSWLNNADNVQTNICIAINYLRRLSSSCGTSVRNLAAGYNGGGGNEGACAASQSCASCSMCGSEQTRRWECLWEGPDGEHKTCNVDRADGSFSETRKYAPKVAYCYSKFGGGGGGGPPGSSQDKAKKLIEAIGLGSFSTDADCGNSFHARQNIQDIAAGKFPAVCSPSCSCKTGGLSGSVTVNSSLLDGLIQLKQSGIGFRVNSLTTGRHSANSSHYKGNGVDIAPNGTSPSEWIKARDFLNRLGGNAFCEDKNGKPVSSCSPIPSQVDHIHWTR